MRWLESWATLCFARGWLVLVSLVTLTGALGGYGFSHFELNSDMDRVITPRDADSWYHEDDMIKQAFPQFRQTVIVVLSGENARDVSNATNAFWIKCLGARYWKASPYLIENHFLIPLGSITPMMRISTN